MSFPLPVLRYCEISFPEVGIDGVDLAGAKRRSRSDIFSGRGLCPGIDCRLESCCS
jgi:hypothetical protein